MIDIKIPYQKDYRYIKLDKSRVNAVLNSRVEEYQVTQTQEEIVKKALENPVESQRLKMLARSAGRVLLITSDHTRPVPSRITLPLILEELRSQNPGIKIKILIATGCHRATTYEEMIDKFGKEIVENEEIINHDCSDKDAMVFKGMLPSGGELWLNKLVDWADLVISEGFIEPHFFAGFSGGRKSILPGIADRRTVYANHCSKFIACNSARTGNLDNNPIHKDMLFAAEAAKLKFILNVVIDGDKKIISAFSGHYGKAHEKGCEFVRQLAQVEPAEADIVITSNGGYPLDQNVYQAVKGMTAAEACVKKGGVIIIAASCNDGHGGEGFYRYFADAASAEEVASEISRVKQAETPADQWQAQILARVLMKSKVIMVSDECNKSIIDNMHMTYASSLEQALQIAEKDLGKKASITVIPDGVGVIVGHGGHGTQGTGSLSHACP